MKPVNYLTRRDFLKALGLAGGAAALYPALRAWGSAPRSTYAGPLRLQGRGDGQQVIILGAGLAGLATAYELGKVGYECRILEARHRAGGRCWTVRGGDSETEIGGEAQTSNFDEGLFFNAGPDRIPQHHRAVLAYCKEFGLPMRAFVTLNTANYYYNENVGPFSGQKVRMGRAWTDLQGYAFELLAKLVDQDRLDLPLDAAGQETMLNFLQDYGNLSDELAYEGASQAGYSEAPGISDASGTPLEPLDRSALLQAEFWNYFPIDWDLNLQMSQLHPQGGMDQLIQALEERVGGQITYQAEVREIRRTPDGVRIVYANGPNGQSQEIGGNYCVCTIPLPVLANLATDFPAEVQSAIASIAYLPGVKTGLQFARRFWEEDDDIYGGVSHTNLNIGQIWYPSLGYQSDKGILTGSYTLGPNAAALGELSPAGRIEETLAQGVKIHPQYPEAFESGFSVAWQRLPYSLGAWAVYTEEQRQNIYPLLNQFDDFIYLAGDHMSYLSGWLEGAVLSAHHVAQRIHQRAQQGG